MVIDSIPLIPMPRYRVCPTERITLVGVFNGHVERDNGDLAKWIFGPDTVNPWPGGDYYVGDEYVEVAFQDYPGFFRAPYAGTYYAIGGDFAMDAGL